MRNKLRIERQSEFINTFQEYMSVLMKIGFTLIEICKFVDVKF